MIKIQFLICLFVPILICSCSSNKIQRTSDESIEKGLYRFIMKDSAGVRIAEGDITISESSNKSIKGTYIFNKVYNEFAGYSSMKGEFDGIVNSGSGTVLINTNPFMADDNVFFSLNIGDGSLKGDWYYSAFRQQEIKGKVSLIKK